MNVCAPSAVHHAANRASGSLWDGQRGDQHAVVQELHRAAAAGLPHGKTHAQTRTRCSNTNNCVNDACASLRPAAPCDHPAVHGNPGEPAVHRRARPTHPGRVPAVLCPAALRHTHTGTCNWMKCVLRNYQLLHQEYPHFSFFFLVFFLCLVPFDWLVGVEDFQK